MNLHKCSKISINAFGGIFLFLTLNFALWTFDFTPILAQDAIQCTPGDINLNRNLKFVNNDNIYLGTGKLNFSSGNNGIYAANDGGNLLLKSPAAILLQSGGDFKFQNSSGNEFAQFFTGATPPLTGAGNLLVNGKIEGLGDVQGGKICVTGGGTQCVSSWSQICDPGGAGKCNAVETNNNIKSGADLSANGNIYTGTGNIYTNNGNIYTTNGKINADNNDINGKRLCIGGACYDSWATAVHGGLNSSYVGTGTGVFKILAGDGISVSGTGEGDVIITNDGVTSLKAGPGITLIGPAQCNGGANDGADCTLPDTANFCGAGVCEQTGKGNMVISSDASGSGASGWRLIAQASDYTEESETTINYPDQIFFTVDSGGYPNQRVNVGNFNGWSPSATTKLIFKAKSASDDFCTGGNGVLNLSGGAGTYPECQDWQLDAGGATTTYVNITDQDDWIRLVINGTAQQYCPDQLGRVSNSASYPGTYGYVNAFDVFCYYEKNTHWNGDLTSFKIQEADWSGGYGSWEWELWGCDDCVDPAGLNSSYLYQLKHTRTQCTDGVDGITGTADDGTIINDSGKYFCKFTTSTDACPAGWLQYNNWSTQIERTCGNGEGNCGGSGKYCTTIPNSTLWSNTAQSTCVYNKHKTDMWGCHSSSYTCYSDITEIGCY